MKDFLTLEDIQRLLRMKKSYMEPQYHVRDMGVFGSCVQGRQPKKSDVDILIDFNKTISAFSYVRL